MNPFTARIVVFFLVPCLVGDPATGAAAASAFAPSGIYQPLPLQTCQSPFTQEAIIARLFSSIHAQSWKPPLQIWKQVRMEIAAKIGDHFAAAEKSRTSTYISMAGAVMMPAVLLLAWIVFKKEDQITWESLVVRLVLSAVAFVLVYPQIADRMDMSLLGIQGSGWSKFGKWGFSRELADIILMKKNPRLKAKAVDVWITTAWHECRVHALSRWIYNSNSERHPHVGTFFEYLIGKAEDLVIAPWVDAWRKWRSVRPSEKDHVDNRFGWPAVTGQSSWVPLERPTSAAPAKVIVLHSPDPELRARPQRSISQTLSLLDGHFFSDPQGLSELVAVLKTMKDMGVQQILAVGVSIYQVSEAFATMGFNTFLMDASLGMINSLIPVRPRKNMVGRYELIHANLDFVELPMNSLLQPDSCDAALLLSLVGGTVSFVGDPFRAIVNAVRYVRHGGTLYLPVEAIPVEMRSKGITLGEILVMLYPGSFRNTTLPPLMSYHGEVNVPYTLVKGAA